MKYKSLFLILAGLSSQVYAQTWNEWAQQGKTQIQYLQQQISALHLYGAYLQKGYQVAKKGLAAISKGKDDEWQLHQDFFGAFKNVNPRIKNEAQVAAILAMQLSTASGANAIMSRCKKSKEPTAQEVLSIVGACSQVMEQNLKSLNELYETITSGEWQMTDGGRWQRVENIYTQVQERFVFIQALGRSFSLLLQNRAHERKEIKQAKILNQLP